MQIESARQSVFSSEPFPSLAKEVSISARSKNLNPLSGSPCNYGTNSKQDQLVIQFLTLTSIVGELFLQIIKIFQDGKEPSSTVGSLPQEPENSASHHIKRLGKTGEFLWKPISEKDKKLVILLPKKFSGKVDEVRILSPNGKKTLATGMKRGVGNGGRQHFRFSKAGSSFPKSSLVEFRTETGDVYHIRIANPGKRYER